MAEAGKFGAALLRRARKRLLTKGFVASIHWDKRQGRRERPTQARRPYFLTFVRRDPKTHKMTNLGPFKLLNPQSACPHRAQAIQETEAGPGNQ